MSDEQLQFLTSKEKKVMDFLEFYIQSKGMSPCFQEIQEHFSFKSINSVQNYLKQLETKGYIHLPGGNRKRAITLVAQSGGATLHPILGRKPAASPSVSEVAFGIQIEAFRIPMLGRVAAGLPIERMSHDEFLDVPRSMVPNVDRTFALRVEGDSMIEDGIFDGDYLLIQQQTHARNGEIVVAVVENEATVKRIYSHSFAELVKLERNVEHSIELRPANHTMSSFWYSDQDVEIRGVVVGLIRRFVS